MHVQVAEDKAGLLSERTATENKKLNKVCVSKTQLPRAWGVGLGNRNCRSFWQLLCV